MGVKGRSEVSFGKKTEARSEVGLAVGVGTGSWSKGRRVKGSVLGLSGLSVTASPHLTVCSELFQNLSWS